MGEEFGRFKNSCLPHRGSIGGFQGLKSGLRKPIWEGDCTKTQASALVSSMLLRKQELKERIQRGKNWPRGQVN